MANHTLRSGPALNTKNHLILVLLLQDSVGRAAVQKIASLYGTYYKVGSICKIICK